MELLVHPRIHERHPEIDENDVRAAWTACLKSASRIDIDPREYIAVGIDSHGRMIEMVGKQVGEGLFLIYHAFTPPTRKALFELGLTDRR